MPLTTNAKGNKNLIKDKVLKTRALGERAKTSHFELRFRGHDDMTLRIAATQLPEMMRHDVEGFGAMGTMINEQGNLKNAGQLTVTVDEYLDGKTAAFIKKSVEEKIYHDIDIAITPEDTGLKPIIERKLEDVYISSEAVDLANEDITGTIKFPLTLNYNWVE